MPLSGATSLPILIPEAALSSGWLVLGSAAPTQLSAAQQGSAEVNHAESARDDFEERGECASSFSIIVNHQKLSWSQKVLASLQAPLSAIIIS